VLRYANCGHNPPLLVHEDFRVTRLAATATVLGVFHDWNCSVCEVALMPGDTLLLFTDGVTEAVNASSEEFGEAGLLGALKENRRLTLHSLVRELLSAVCRFSGDILGDDVTLLAARPIAPN
jgi:sigma-B regulation protein RsbU (phosphoserine phosphatase)